MEGQSMGFWKKFSTFIWPWNGVAILVWIALLLLHSLSFDSYVWLATEDKFGENMTSVFYLLAAVFLIFTSFRNIKKKRHSLIKETLPLLLALFFIFIAGEEISWGQRIFNIATPETIRDTNVQGEMNLHNLSFFDRNAAILNQHTALNVFALLMGLVFPICYSIWPFFRRVADRLFFPIVPLSCSMWFFVGLANGQTLAKIHPHWAHAEIKELLFSIGFCIFGYLRYRSRND